MMKKQKEKKKITIEKKYINIDIYLNELLTN